MTSQPPRAIIILHMINHGADHYATVLEKPNEFGAVTFTEDLILRFWSKKQNVLDTLHLVTDLLAN